MKLTHRGDRIFDYTVTVLSLMLVIVLGSILASAAETYSRNRQNEILDNLFLKENTVARELLTDTRAYQIAFNYAKAWLGAAASFEELPYGDLEIYFTLIKALPIELEMQSITYQGKDLQIECSVNDLADGENFVADLKGSGLFGDVTFSYYETNQGNYQLSVMCYAERLEPLENPIFHLGELMPEGKIKWNQLPE